MPATAEWLAKKEPALGPEVAGHLEQPEHSLRMGAHYLRRMLDREDGNIAYAAGAYNAGPGNVGKWRKAQPGQELEKFIEEIPFSETHGFVCKVLGNYAAYRSLYADR